MTTAAKSAFGTTLARNGNTIAELANIGSPKLTQGVIDVTNHQSADDYAEYIGGILDGGEVGLEGNFIASDSNGQVGLVTDMNAHTVQSFVITFPASTGTTWTFSALVTAFQIDDAPSKDGKLGFKAALKVTGKPTLAVATSAGLTTPFFTINNSAVITPTPAQATTTYVATVLTAITSVIVTPTAAAGTIVITANGASQTVATGVASSAITLGSAGSVTTITIAVTETNKATKTYTIYVDRP